MTSVFTIHHISGYNYVCAIHFEKTSTCSVFFEKMSTLNLHVHSESAYLIAFLYVALLVPSLALNNWHEHHQISQIIVIGSDKWSCQDISVIILRPYVCQTYNTNGKSLPHMVIRNQFFLLFQVSWWQSRVKTTDIVSPNIRYVPWPSNPRILSFYLVSATIYLVRLAVWQPTNIHM